MQHFVAIIWDGDEAVSGRGVLRDSHTRDPIAGPGEKVRVDMELAERLVREGKAHYPRN